MFDGATNFDQDLSPWNIDAVTSVENMFLGATAFSQTLCWDTSGKTVTGMFAGSSGSIGCTALTDSNFQTACDAWVIDSSAATIEYGNIKFWDTSSVTNMGVAFNGASSFNDDISAWDVSSVTSMEHVSNERMTCCLAAYGMLPAFLFGISTQTISLLLTLSFSSSLPLL
jgi:surface protein